MSKFTDAHVEQIRNMHKDGKSYSEIVAFMKDSYSIKAWPSEISTICKGGKAPKQKVARKKKGTANEKVARGGGSCACRHKVICKYADECKPEICKYAEI